MVDIMSKTVLKKSEVRAYMYKGRFSNKELFWQNVLKTREQRAIYNKPIFDRFTDIEIRYRKQISTVNFNKIREIIFRAVGTPSFVNCHYYAGNPKKSGYTGNYQGDSYSSRCTYRKTYHSFDIYATRQLNIEIECIDGLYNLECKTIKQIGNITIYKASWIISKRGYNFEVVSGYIAYNTVNHISYHATTVKKAIEGLERKIKRQVKTMLKSDSIIDLKTFQKFTGACDAGCENFLNRHNIDKDSKMTALEVVKLLEDKNQNSYAEKLKRAIY